MTPTVPEGRVTAAILTFACATLAGGTVSAASRKRNFHAAFWTLWFMILLRCPGLLWPAKDGNTGQDDGSGGGWR